MDKNPLYQGNHYVVTSHNQKSNQQNTALRSLASEDLSSKPVTTYRDTSYSRVSGSSTVFLTVQISIIQKKRIIPNECLKEIESLHTYIFITYHCKNASILKKNMSSVCMWYIYIYITYYKQDILPKSIFLTHKSGFPSIQIQTLIWSNLSKKARLASNAPNINLPCSSTVASRFSCAKVFLMTRMPWLCHKPYSTSHVAGECCGPPIFFQHLQEVPCSLTLFGQRALCFLKFRGIFKNEIIMKRIEFLDNYAMIWNEKNLIWPPKKQGTWVRLI